MAHALHDPVRHNAWATAQLLEFCRGLDEQTLNATVPGTYGTIIATLRHIIHCEIDFLERLLGREPSDPWQLGVHMTQSQPQGFLALPPTGKGPGVLVLHAWWGLNDTIKAFCTRLAEAGFVAFAPDLYHGKVADTIADAETLGSALDANHLQAKAEIVEAARFLDERADQGGPKGRPGLTVIGFSLGAYYALNLAAAEPERIHSVVIFYGTGGDDFSGSRATYLGHFAEMDEFEPQANVDNLEEALKRAGRPVTFYRYSDTGHWFFEPDRAQAFNPEAARLAWDRTLAFLRRSSPL